MKTSRQSIAHEGEKQNQALSALLFLYGEAFRQDLDRPIDAVRAKRPRRLPTVLNTSPAHYPQTE